MLVLTPGPRDALNTMKAVIYGHAAAIPSGFIAGW